MECSDYKERHEDEKAAVENEERTSWSFAWNAERGRMRSISTKTEQKGGENDAIG
jgi:hypothetical protein